MSKHTISISPEIRDILSQCEIGRDLVKITAQLDRKTYEEVNKVLVAAGGKWNRAVKGHIFSRDPREVLGLAIEKGEIIDTKKENQQFFTPTDLAARMADYLFAYYRESDSKGLKILEPNAGEAALIKVLKPHLKENDTIHAVEKDETLIPGLKYLAANVVCGDFLSRSPSPTHDLIIMNPPFTNGQDCQHVMHAYNFLAEGGRLVALMSPSFTFRDTGVFKKFKQFFEEKNGQILEEVPEGTFKESGTNIRTILIQFHK